MESNCNVTIRKRPMQRSLPQSPNESTDSLASTPDFNIKSMVDLSTHFNDDKFVQLNNTIDDLRGQIITAHHEIELLRLENISLKQELQSDKQLIEKYKSVYYTSATESNTSRSTKSSSNTSRRKLNLDIDCQTPRSSFSLKHKS